jgi:hypothetical protein
MPTKNEIEQFSKMIEELANQKHIGLVDAICYHCKQTELEIEIAATLLSSALKAKINVEAQNLNLIKKSSTLPI